MRRLILAALTCSLLTGCPPAASPERTTIREGMHNVTRTIREQHKDWAGKLVVDPATGKDHRAELPTLTPAQANQINLTHKEYDDLVTEDRARDPLYPK